MTGQLSAVETAEARAARMRGYIVRRPVGGPAPAAALPDFAAAQPRDLVRETVRCWGCGFGATVRWVPKGRYRFDQDFTVACALCGRFAGLAWQHPATLIGSPIERRMAEYLTDLAVPFFWQSVVKRHNGHPRITVDFAVLRGGAGLLIECDGKLHELTKEKDAQRDAELRGGGWHVMRFPGREIYGDGDAITYALYAWYHNNGGHPGPLPGPGAVIKVN